MSNQQIQTPVLVKQVQFMGKTLFAAQTKNGETYVDVQQICSELGLSGSCMQSEILRIHNNSMLRDGLTQLQIQDSSEVKLITGLQINYATLWLVQIGITPTMLRQNPQLINKLQQYRLNLKDTINDAFVKTNPIPRMTDDEIIIGLSKRSDKSIQNIFEHLPSRRKPNKTPIQIARIQDFLIEILPQCKWDVLPFGFLYDLYIAWCKKTNTANQQCGRNTFITNVKNIVAANTHESFTAWLCEERQPLHPGHRMDTPEPLILTYNLTNWANHGYTKKDKYCRTPLKTSYKGLTRKL